MKRRDVLAPFGSRPGLLADEEEDHLTEELVLSVDPQVSELLRTLEKHLHNRREEIMRKCLGLAIVGPPNAVKSSLLNALTQRDVAIVSDTAGAMKDILETVLDIEGSLRIHQDSEDYR